MGVEEYLFNFLYTFVSYVDLCFVIFKKKTYYFVK